MDVERLCNGDYVTPDLVKNAKDKRCVILDEGRIETTKFGDALIMKVQVDTEIYDWTMNRETLRNLRDAYGKDSKLWVSKLVMLTIMEKNGKRFVVGIPLTN